ncbi:hypothetical protein LCGC14_0017080 [marine sediment metagenome]|uniref:Uncharacterized protein n=1 Tax=marine sediment metagenome TaxID=412755 RepID=A0A0F9YG86_9ZZZZ
MLPERTPPSFSGLPRWALCLSQDYYAKGRSGIGLGWPGGARSDGSLRSRGAGPFGMPPHRPRKLTRLGLLRGSPLASGPPDGPGTPSVLRGQGRYLGGPGSTPPLRSRRLLVAGAAAWALILVEHRNDGTAPPVCLGAVTVVIIVTSRQRLTGSDDSSDGNDDMCSTGVGAPDRKPIARSTRPPWSPGRGDYDRSTAGRSVRRFTVSSFVWFYVPASCSVGSIRAVPTRSLDLTLPP